MIWLKHHTYRCILGVVAYALLYSTQGIAQASASTDDATTRISNLVHIIESAPNDTSTFHLMDSLGKLYGSQNKYDKAYDVAHQMLALSEEISYGKGAAIAHANIAFCAFFLGDYSDALFWYRQALKSSIEFLDDYHISVAYGNLGLIYQDIGQYDSALVNLFECLKYRQELNDSVHLSYTHYDIAELYGELKNFERSVHHHRIALNIRKKIRHIEDSYNVIEDSYSALAVALHREGNDTGAVSLLHQALAINREKEDGRREASTLRVLGDIEYDGVSYDKALEYYQQAEALDNQINNQEFKALNSINLAKTLLKLNKPALAVTLYNEALEHASTIRSKPQIYESLEGLTTAHKAAQNFEQALRYATRAGRLKDTLLNEKNARLSQEMAAIYETNQKEAQINELSKQKELSDLESARKSAEIRQTYILLGSSLIGLLLLGIIILIVFRNNRKRKAINAQLLRQKKEIEDVNTQIEESLLVKESLLKEIHHRVKNNLQIISSLLNLQSANLTDEAAQDAIREGQNRVKSIALIHQKLYQTEDLSQVDFQEYIEQLVSFLQSSLRLNKDVTFQIRANNIQLDIDSAVPLGLIANELITNAYKYAFEGVERPEINIDLSRLSNEQFRLVIRDNGKGMPEGFEVSKASSLGAKLIHILTRQLKGTVQWANNSGTEVTLDFKNSSARK